MTFDHPALLFVLVLPAAWLAWHFLHHGHALRLPFDHGNQCEGRLLRGVVNGFGAMPALLLAVAVVLLAGPRTAAPPKTKRVMSNIIIAIDISGSMGQVRYDAAMEEARRFCEYREGDAFGLTVFGKEYLHWFPPTKDLSAIRNALPFVSATRHLPRFAGTLIGNALEGCRERLVRAEEGDRAVIVLTDGGSSDFKDGKDLELARRLAADRIRVFTILIGNDPPGPGINGVFNVASITSGKVFRADDQSALAEIFSEIDRMQKARFEQVTADKLWVYRPFSIAGLAAAGLWLLALFGLRFTPW